MRAALCVRVPTTERPKKLSLRAQEEALRQYADEDGLGLVRLCAVQCSGMHWGDCREPIWAPERWESMLGHTLGTGP